MPLTVDIVTKQLCISLWILVILNLAKNVYIFNEQASGDGGKEKLPEMTKEINREKPDLFRWLQICVLYFQKKYNFLTRNELCWSLLLVSRWRHKNKDLCGNLAFVEEPLS